MRSVLLIIAQKPSTIAAMVRVVALVSMAALCGCRRPAPTPSPEAIRDAAIAADASGVVPSVDAAASDARAERAMTVGFAMVSYDNGTASGSRWLVLTASEPHAAPRDVIIAGEHSECSVVPGRDIGTDANDPTVGTHARAMIAAVQCMRPQQTLYALVRSERGAALVRVVCDDYAASCAAPTQVVANNELTEIPVTATAEGLVERPAATLPPADTSRVVTVRVVADGPPMLLDAEPYEPASNMAVVFGGALSRRVELGMMRSCYSEEIPQRQRARRLVGIQCSIGDHYAARLTVERVGADVLIRHGVSEEMGVGAGNAVVARVRLPAGATVRAIEGDFRPREPEE
jgi:hypothetical protein